MLTHKEMSSRGGKARWDNKTEEEKSEIMSDVRKKGLKYKKKRGQKLSTGSL